VNESTVDILSQPQVPAELLHAVSASAERLARRGVAMLLVAADRSIVWQPEGLPDFLKRYVLGAVGQLRLQDSAEWARRGIVSAEATSPDRRFAGKLLLLGRSEDFAADEWVQQLCQRLALDTQWAIAAGTSLTGYTCGSMATVAESTVTAIQAELRANGTGTELESLSQQLADSYEELTLIYQLSSGMRVNRTTADFFMQACEELMSVMQVRGCGVVLCDPAGNPEEPTLFGETQLDHQSIARLSADLCRRFQVAPKPLMVNDVLANPLVSYLSPQVGRFLAVAMQRQDKLMGVLFCMNKIGDEFSTTDSKLLGSIGNEMAVFVENSNLFADARGLLMGLLHAMTGAVDAKDPYTRGHSQRVSLFSREIALLAGLPDSFCERVYMAGLLHDVGKIGVREDVLRKPGKLTDEEFDEMKKHVDIGARILRDVKQVQDLVPGVLHHHERYDGKGYPHKLAGQSIPLLARILCVADCFDAMTSNRTYRKALPVEVALMEIRRCAGTQFDPALAEAFLSIGADRLRSLMDSVGEHDASILQLAA
jgi:HD-GYP domain-containing protein (c-di-GMP phosphodiesterase class II)